MIECVPHLPATSATDHQRRTVHGVALGDLDHDGFVDIVSVSNFDQPAPLPLAPFPASHGSVFDAGAQFVPTFTPAGGGTFEFTGLDLPDGGLSVEIDDGGTGYGWVKIDTVGSVGLVDGGMVNRDGIGAVVTFTPDGGKTAMRPIVAGSSYASSHSTDALFGLGSAAQGTVDVLWPGGARNRLVGVASGERIVFPEIPCSIDTSDDQQTFATCVSEALEEIAAAGTLDEGQTGRLAKSMMAAYQAEHR